ncbi:COG1629 Outer membrane receptor proteins [Vibrio sp. B1FLJ16]|nr:COG1629 Outer membrane receptor proteins [Vibrio sp. B1FLJ16]CAE6900620.1 COG1629 Outer membrane receptor proteins [Vibrio sp. B1FLJ16]
MSRNIYDTDEDSQSFVIDNQLSGTVKFGSNEHNLLFGIDYLKLKGNSSYREYAGNTEFYSFNIFNPNNNLLDTSAVTEVYDESHKIKTEQLGFYLQDQIRLGDWVLLAGGRYDLFEASDVKTSTIVAGTRDTADHNQFSYRVGALYEFSNGLSPFASYATSFEPAAGTDIDGKALKPQLGEQIEVGVKYQSLDSATEMTASYFHITKEDAVSYDPNDPTYRAKIQLGEVRSQGLELEGRWFVTDAWDINASYSYMDIEITKDVDGALVGTTPIYVPEHSANLWTNYYLYNGPLAGARIGGGVRYVGEMQMDAYNVSGNVPSYTLVDLSLGYDLGLLSDTLDGTTANLVVNNLFDEESYTCYDSMNCWYGSERSVEAKFEYNF